MATTRSMARAFATDRLSELSDNLLLTHILSKLSYRDVVRSSLLSQRWQFLWKKVPFLYFHSQDFEKQKDEKIGNIIDNALFCQEANIWYLDIQIALDNPNSVDINNWIRLAAEKQVEQMALQFYDRDTKTGKRLKGSCIMELGDSVFKCERLTALNLRFINLPKIPTDFGVFQSLRTFSCYNNLNMDDAMFEAFMDLCPHLQNLGIRACFRLTNLKIHASNLMYLNLGLLRCDLSVQVACPRLTEINLIDGGTYGQCQGLRLLPGISGAGSVKIITLQNYRKVNPLNPGIPSITALNGFPQLEELTMHGQCFQEMISDEEMPIAEVTLPNLKMVRAHIGLEKGIQAVTFLSFFLRNSPLTVMRIFLPKHCSGIMRNKLLDLEQEFSKSRLSTVPRKWSMQWKNPCQFCETYSRY